MSDPYEPTTYSLKRRLVELEEQVKELYKIVDNLRHFVFNRGD